MRWELSEKKINPLTGRKKRFYRKLRYYHCGEYGEPTPENNFIARPHYHAILFDLEFPKTYHWKTVNHVPLFRSPILERIWGKGHCTIGTVTFESAAYVARYIMKKVNGEDAEAHYEKININTGEIINLQPEYTTMSRKPGIGKPWLDKYESDVYPDDFIIVNNHKMGVPKYYDNQIEQSSSVLYEAIKKKRKKNALAKSADATPERLAVRRICKEAQLSQLKRNL